MRIRPSIDDIVDAAAHVYGVDSGYVRMDTNRRDVVRIRQIVHYLARHLTRNTLREIGKQVGGRDHATVLHSIKVVTREYKMYDDTKFLVDYIRMQLKESGLCIQTNIELYREELAKEHKKHKKVWQQISIERQGMIGSATL